MAQSRHVRAMVEADRSLVEELVILTEDDDWLVAQRALDLLEKLAHDHPEWVAPHKDIFVGPLANSDKWEIRLQIVRALPLFAWTPRQLRAIERILVENISFPQTFVRAWALDSLSRLAEQRPALRPIVQRHLELFEQASSKALQARARHVRARVEAWSGTGAPRARRE
jgi:hypothetical protein